jgi:hypothetical protein
MKSAAFKSFVQSVIVLNVIILSVVALHNLISQLTNIVFLPKINKIIMIGVFTSEWMLIHGAPERG